MKESTIEKYFTDTCARLGLRQFKLAAIEKGWPDRTVLPGDGEAMFVELKKPKGGKLSEHQIQTHRELIDLGHAVDVLWTKEHVDEWVRCYFRVS